MSRHRITCVTHQAACVHMWPPSAATSPKLASVENLLLFAFSVCVFYHHITPLDYSHFTQLSLYELRGVLDHIYK